MSEQNKPQNPKDDPVESLRNLLTDFGLIEALQESVAEDQLAEQDRDGVPLTLAKHVWEVLQDADDGEAPDGIEDEVPEGIVNYNKKTSIGTKKPDPNNQGKFGLPKKPAFSSTLKALEQMQRLPSAAWKNSPLTVSVRNLEAEAVGGARGRWDFSVVMGGAPGDATKHSLSAEYGCWNDGSIVFLRYPDEMIPNGLCWLVIPEPNDGVTLYLPKLRLNKKAGRWSFRASIEDLLRRRPEKILEPSVVPLNEKTADCFDGDEVRQFIESLDKDCDQRIRAERFFARKEQSNGHE